MHINYAVDRLYEVGWLPTDDASGAGSDLERLSDGRRHPSVAGVQKHFAQAGLKLTIKPKASFKCYQATWSPLESGTDARFGSDDRRGTVVGSCEREAAVYALAQLLATQADVSLAAS